MEKIKAKIEFFKTLFLVFVTALFSMIGYFFINIQMLLENYFKFYILLYVIIVLILVVFSIVVKWLKEIGKLEG